MTDYVATTFKVEVKNGESWKPHIDDTTEYRIELSARKAASDLRNKYPKETFRVMKYTTTYTRQEEVLVE